MPPLMNDGTPGQDRGWRNTHPNRLDNHPKHEMRPGITPNLSSNETLVNNKSSSTQHPKSTIMIKIMVICKLETRVTVALWDCLLIEYPEPHLTMDYGIPSNTTIRYYSREIDWKVSRTMTAPSSSKQPKMGEPSKYSGNRNHDVFLQWLNQFLNWLRSHYHCGDNADFSLINFLENYLDRVAADWFAANINNPDKVMDAPFTFIDAICAIHR